MKIELIFICLFKECAKSFVIILFTTKPYCIGGKDIALHIFYFHFITESIINRVVAIFG